MENSTAKSAIEAYITNEKFRERINIAIDSTPQTEEPLRELFAKAFKKEGINVDSNELMRAAAADPRFKFESLGPDQSNLELEDEDEDEVLSEEDLEKVSGGFLGLAVMGVAFVGGIGAMLNTPAKAKGGGW